MAMPQTIYGTTVQSCEKYEYGSSESCKSKQKSSARGNFSSINNKLFSPLVRQLTITCGILLSTVSGGMTAGYSAILLPQLMDTNSTIPITHEEASWIASSAALTMALGCVLIGPVMTYFGRKTSVMATSVIFVIGWICINQATNLYLIIIGRILTGLCTGALGPIGAVYIAECSDPKYRGFLLGGISLAVSIGIFLAHILGTYLSWQQTSFICAISPCVAFFIITFVPESPTYLASKSDFLKAEYSFKWYRGTSMKALEDMNVLFSKYKNYAINQDQSGSESIMKSVEVMRTEKTQINPTRLSLDHEVSFKEYITKSYFWKPLLIINVFFAVTQFSGVNSIVFYSVTILRDSLGTNIDSYFGMMVIDLIRNVMSVIACVILRKYSRRSLAMYSTLGTALSLIFLAVFIHFTDKYESLKEYGYIPLTALVVYICFISIGLVPLPWVMVGEIFPSPVRNFGTGLSSCMGFIYFFIVVKTAPMLFTNLGCAGVFGLYGCFAVIGLFCLYKYLPETKDKTLEDIEEYFMKK